MARPLPDDPGFSTYLAAIRQFEPLEREAELALARRWQEDGDRRAADALVRANLRFVVQLARRYRGYGLRLTDLVEEGNIGLCEAVRRFDPSRGLRFMTYAAYWVRALMLAHVLKQWSLVSAGTGPLQSRLFFRLTKERARLTSALGATESQEAVEARLAAQFGTSPARVREMTSRLEAKDLSLDSAAFRDGDATALELLADGREGQEDRYSQKERAELVRLRVYELARQLSARERLVLSRRLWCDEPEPLAAVGERLGLSRERVRQIEEQLKRKLRAALPELAPTGESAPRAPTQPGSPTGRGREVKSVKRRRSGADVSLENTHQG